MLKFVSILGILTLSFSCNPKPIKNKNNNIDTSSFDKYQKIDSLDADTSSFSTKQQPDTVGIVLHKISDTLMSTVNFVSAKKKTMSNIALSDSLSNIFKGKGFEIDSADSPTIEASQKQFNTRSYVSWTKNNVDTIIIQAFVWYKGDKYSLVSARWNK